MERRDVLKGLLGAGLVGVPAAGLTASTTVPVVTTTELKPVGLDWQTEIEQQLAEEAVVAQARRAPAVPAPAGVQALHDYRRQLQSCGPHQWPVGHTIPPNSIPAYWSVNGTIGQLQLKHPHGLSAALARIDAAAASPSLLLLAHAHIYDLLSTAFTDAFREFKLPGVRVTRFPKSDLARSARLFVGRVASPKMICDVAELDLPRLGLILCAGYMGLIEEIQCKLAYLVEHQQDLYSMLTGPLFLELNINSVMFEMWTHVQVGGHGYKVGRQPGKSITARSQWLEDDLPYPISGSTEQRSRDIANKLNLLELPRG